MIFYVAGNSSSKGLGTKEQPFQTISQAAAIARGGDTIIVAPGIYREYVNPRYGGTGDDDRVTYISQVPLGAVITGAEEIKKWTHYEGDVWFTRIPNGFFNNYNPYTTIIKGDWYQSTILNHTGEVYLNGRSLYEVSSLNEVLHPETCLSSWDPDHSLYKWYTEQDGDVTVIYANFRGADPRKENVEINVRRNCFFPDKTGVGYITLTGFVIKQAATTWAPPTAFQDGMIGPHWSKGWIIEDCEISHSKCSGISLGKYLQPNNENKWTTKFYKDGTQTEREAICQAQTEGWNKDNIGSHTIRRCNIHDCGQTGIVGHLGGVFSLIEDNHIHHINNKQNLLGAEIGGIKMHAAIDVIIRRNHFHHCTRGLWLDWQAQGTRVSQNLFHDNVPPKGIKVADVGEDIFIEVSHGPTLIDNNLLLSDCAARISTQGIAFVHNLISGSFTYVGLGTDNGGRRLPTPRYTPYHLPHRTEVAGFMTILHGDARFYNNIFVQKEIRKDFQTYAKEAGLEGLNLLHFTCGTKPYDDYPRADDYFAQFNAQSAIDHEGKDIYYDHLPIYTGGNIYFNGAIPCNNETGYIIDDKNSVFINLTESDGAYRLKTNLYDYLPEFEMPFINTDVLGEAFEPEQKFESPDGSPILFDCDYFGKRRKAAVIPGPFACGEGAAAVLI